MDAALVYLQKGLGLTPMQSGYTVMFVTLAVILCNLLVSALSQRALKRGTSVQRAMVMHVAPSAIFPASMPRKPRLFSLTSWTRAWRQAEG